jgi:hypothetical protein
MQQAEEHICQMNQVNDIRKLEHIVQLKKKEHQARVQEVARERYEEQVRAHEDARSRMEEEISKLEQREKELISRLKQTQNHHQLYLDDLDRIMHNEEPLNIVVQESKRPRTAKK